MAVCMCPLQLRGFLAPGTSSTAQQTGSGTHLFMWICSPKEVTLLAGAAIRSIHDLVQARTASQASLWLSWLREAKPFDLQLPCPHGRRAFLHRFTPHEGIGSGSLAPLSAPNTALSLPSGLALATATCRFSSDPHFPMDNSFEEGPALYWDVKVGFETHLRAGWGWQLYTAAPETRRALSETRGVLTLSTHHLGLPKPFLSTI